MPKNWLRPPTRSGRNRFAWLMKRRSKSCARRSSTSREIFLGEIGLREIACLTNADMVLVAIVGTGGLRPALAAIEAGKDLAVASKEILVMAGEIVMREARDNGVHVLPVDSEHNAIFQCLEGEACEPARRYDFRSRDVRRILLTASGGPFRESPAINSIRSHRSRRSSIRPGTWARRSRSIPPRCSTKGWR